MKITIIVGAIIALGVAGGAWYMLDKNVFIPVAQTADYENISYTIEGQPITLVNGKAETASAPGGATKIITQYFGNETTGDLNGDGVSDVAFLLTQDMGGSGTFYYVVAAIKTAIGYTGTSAVLLGDRIAPQTTEIKNGQLIVNYADRNSGESMTAQPSVGKSLYLKLDAATMQFGEVVQNFEGEANPATMTLNMKTWVWISTLYGNNKTVMPKKPQVFTLTFKKDGSFSATTDCNSVGGKYAVKGSTITFSQMMSTLMYCDGSQEGDFNAMLRAVQTYHFTTKGELIFDLKLDTGSVIFL